MVEVDEDENTEFADPPRKWKRVGTLTAGWIILLALGAWVAPGFAATGSPEDEDPWEADATDAKGAAWSYLVAGSSGDLKDADNVLCADASPEVKPSDLNSISEDYAKELGGAPRIDASTGDPISVAAGVSITGTVSYNYRNERRFEEFMVTVQEFDSGKFCVSDAVRTASQEPSSDDSSTEVGDPALIANDYMTQIVGNRDVTAATEMQCDSFFGIMAVQLNSVIGEWETENGWRSGYSLGAVENENSETSATIFDVSIKLEGEIAVETFDFIVGVQGDCVSSVEGGEGLVAGPED
ncbi:hypothetical protein [Glycomyces paridis]|uniref:Uncharacterized protein n=1 Tax=Glycomyces paridis TaxID=2126555 RepID=A0A4S8PHQ9_9ACTN|nr:hypothetical protein [Glycomyces paridis]THV30127.1 hypothetical protein E9998_07045 [Glycomyces paridis]